MIYDSTSPKGKKRVLANVRPLGKPATFYHEGDGKKPIDQTLIVSPQYHVQRILETINRARLKE